MGDAAVGPLEVKEEDILVVRREAKLSRVRASERLLSEGKSRMTFRKDEVYHKVPGNTQGGGSLYSAHLWAGDYFSLPGKQGRLSALSIIDPSLFQAASSFGGIVQNGLSYYLPKTCFSVGMGPGSLSFVEGDEKSEIFPLFLGNDTAPRDEFRGVDLHRRYFIPTSVFGRLEAIEKKYPDISFLIRQPSGEENFPYCLFSVRDIRSSDISGFFSDEGIPVSSCGGAWDLALRLFSLKGHLGPEANLLDAFASRSELGLIKASSCPEITAVWNYLDFTAAKPVYQSVSFSFPQLLQEVALAMDNSYLSYDQFIESSFEVRKKISPQNDLIVPRYMRESERAMWAQPSKKLDTIAPVDDWFLGLQGRLSTGSAPLPWESSGRLFHGPFRHDIIEREEGERDYLVPFYSNLFTDRNSQIMMQKYRGEAISVKGTIVTNWPAECIPCLNYSYNTSGLLGLHCQDLLHDFYLASQLRDKLLAVWVNKIQVEEIARQRWEVPYVSEGSSVYSRLRESRILHAYYGLILFIPKDDWDTDAEALCRRMNSLIVASLAGFQPGYYGYVRMLPVAKSSVSNPCQTLRGMRVIPVRGIRVEQFAQLSNGEWVLELSEPVGFKLEKNEMKFLSRVIKCSRLLPPEAEVRRLLAIPNEARYRDLKEIRLASCPKASWVSLPFRPRLPNPLEGNVTRKICEELSPFATALPIGEFVAVDSPGTRNHEQGYRREASGAISVALALTKRLSKENVQRGFSGDEGCLSDREERACVIFTFSEEKVEVQEGEVRLTGFLPMNSVLDSVFPGGALLNGEEWVRQIGGLFKQFGRGLKGHYVISLEEEQRKLAFGTIEGKKGFPPFTKPMMGYCQWNLRMVLNRAPEIALETMRELFRGDQKEEIVNLQSIRAPGVREWIQGVTKKLQDEGEKNDQTYQAEIRQVLAMIGSGDFSGLKESYLSGWCREEIERLYVQPARVRYEISTIFHFFDDSLERKSEASKEKEREMLARDLPANDGLEVTKDILRRTENWPSRQGAWLSSPGSKLRIQLAGGVWMINPIAQTLESYQKAGRRPPKEFIYARANGFVCDLSDGKRSVTGMGSRKALARTDAYTKWVENMEAPKPVVSLGEKVLDVAILDAEGYEMLHSNSLIVGFDLEHPTDDFHPSCIQISSGKSVLLFFPGKEPKIPFWLARLINDPKVKKCGFAIQGDLDSLRLIGLKPENFIDLKTICEGQELSDLSLERSLGHFAGFRMSRKGRGIETSFSDDLSFSSAGSDRLLYAAEDAAACFVLAEKFFGPQKVAQIVRTQFEAIPERTFVVEKIECGKIPCKRLSWNDVGKVIAITDGVRVAQGRVSFEEEEFQVEVSTYSFVQGI